MCACAAVSGARSIEEVAEFGQRACRSVPAALGVRRHLLGRRRSPSAATIGRVLAALDGDALDRAVSAYLAGQHRAAECDRPFASGHRRGRQDPQGLGPLGNPGPAPAVGRRPRPPSRRSLRSRSGRRRTKPRHFRPLLAPLELAGTIVTFDALRLVKATITWLVTAKKAHYIAVIKTNQPTTHRQLATLPWNAIPVQHTASTAAHGRRESRSIKICAIAANLGGINFPHARLAVRCSPPPTSGTAGAPHPVTAMVRPPARRSSVSGTADGTRGPGTARPPGLVAASYPEPCAAECRYRG